MRRLHRACGLALVALLALAGLAALLVDGAVLRVGRGPCFGRCPASTAWVLRGGAVIALSGEGATLPGLRLAWLGPQRAQALIADAATLLDAPAAPGLAWRDAPPRTLALYADGRWRQIEVAGLGGPRAARFDAIAAASGLLTPRP